MARRGETLELAVLGLLHEAPLHGYELRKRLNAVLGWGRVLSYGSLYPALKKLLRAGMIAEDAGAAPSTAPSERPRDEGGCAHPSRGGPWHGITRHRHRDRRRDDHRDEERS